MAGILGNGMASPMIIIFFFKQNTKPLMYFGLFCVIQKENSYYVRFTGGRIVGMYLKLYFFFSI